jgi:hypothetical protein
MSTEEIITIIKRYCDRNEIVLDKSVAVLRFAMNYLTKKHYGEQFIIVIMANKYLNRIYTITTKSEMPSLISASARDNYFKYVPLSDLIKEERTEKILILLK